jgi:hypothetical protein
MAFQFATDPTTPYYEINSLTHYLLGPEWFLSL